MTANQLQYQRNRIAQEANLLEHEKNQETQRHNVETESHARRALNYETLQNASRFIKQALDDYSILGIIKGFNNNFGGSLASGAGSAIGTLLA